MDVGHREMRAIASSKQSSLLILSRVGVILLARPPSPSAIRPSVCPDHPVYRCLLRVHFGRFEDPRAVRLCDSVGLGPPGRRASAGALFYQATQELES